MRVLVVCCLLQSEAHAVPGPATTMTDDPSITHERPEKTRAERASCGSKFWTGWSDQHKILRNDAAYERLEPRQRFSSHAKFVILASPKSRVQDLIDNHMIKRADVAFIPEAWPTTQDDYDTAERPRMHFGHACLAYLLAAGAHTEPNVKAIGTITRSVGPLNNLPKDVRVIHFRRNVLASRHLSRMQLPDCWHPRKWLLRIFLAPTHLPDPCDTPASLPDCPPRTCLTTMHLLEQY